ncbi:MAG: OmpA family protein [Flavobacteriaceae bacterium]|nr:OmpA family protein [Flavobacteriaceae bacterium]
MKKVIITIIVLCCSLGMQAQERGMRKANRLYDRYAFNPAIDVYQKVAERGYKSKELFQKLGNAYYFNSDYTNAVKWYGELFKMQDIEVAPEYFFRFAQALKSVKKYNASDKMMQQFYQRSKEDPRAKLFLEQGDYLKNINNQAAEFRLKLAKFNSKYSDFAPAYYKKGLLFASDRDTGFHHRVRHKWNNKAFLDIYQQKEDKRIVKMEELQTIKLHESSSLLTKDGKTLYFTRNNSRDNKKIKNAEGITKLKIYKAEWVDDVWTNITPLPFCSDDYSVAHPALNFDETKMYFASDMPGTLGASDIFEVEIKEDGSFGTPVNLGAAINTPSRETFPFYASDGLLYFASDGRPGLGGLDLFAAKMEEDNTIKVANLGSTVNSPQDDFSLVLNDKSNKGYMASNRPNGLGGDDIYAFDVVKPVVFECLREVFGQVVDKNSGEPIAGANVVVVNQNNDIISTTKADKNGNYVTEIRCDMGNFIRASKKKYSTNEIFVNTASIDNNFIIPLEKQEVIVDQGGDLAKVLDLGIIYFAFDSDEIRPNSRVELEKIIVAMEKYPSLKIEVRSHTDSRGMDDYNMKLSERRAQATVRYIISRGIYNVRIKGRGYGETQLLNECKNGVKCSETKHSVNRRSEFVIME